MRSFNLLNEVECEKRPTYLAKFGSFKSEMNEDILDERSGLSR